MIHIAVWCAWSAMCSTNSDCRETVMRLLRICCETAAELPWAFFEVFSKIFITKKSEKFSDFVNYFFSSFFNICTPVKLSRAPVFCFWNCYLGVSDPFPVFCTLFWRKREYKKRKKGYKIRKVLKKRPGISEEAVAPFVGGAAASPVWWPFNDDPPRFRRFFAVQTILRGSDDPSEHFFSGEVFLIT